MSAFPSSVNVPLSSYAEHVLNQDRSAVPLSSLQNKVIGFYFSAHWCGPCRNFTPKLAERYRDLLRLGEGQAEGEAEALEIVFVSGDESDEEAMSYFESMPWKILDYEQRHLEEELSRKFEVRGIPTLVLVDAEGNLLTTEGREALFAVKPSGLKEYLAEKAENERRQQEELARLKESFKPAKFFGGVKVVDHDGNTYGEDHFNGKLVGIYFSAHWCPPCRGFTPVLAEKYKNFIADGKPFEIVFVSSDRDSNSAAEYFKEMPWKMLNYEDRQNKSVLSELFDVSGIPTLVLANEQGLITDEGREAIMTSANFEKIATFAEDKRAELALLEAEVASYPETITIDEHPHPLMKLPKVYRGQYGCDGCSGGGSGWVYHCDECGFDMHPKCALKSLNKDE